MVPELCFCVMEDQMLPFVYIFRLVLLGCLIFMWNDGQVEGEQAFVLLSPAWRSKVIETGCLVCAFMAWFQRNAISLQVEFMLS